MTKKRNTKFLLLAVVLIYAAIVARFFMLRSDGGNSDPVLASNITFSPKEYKVKEEFKITNNYRDPFLGKLPVSPSKPRISVKGTTAKVAQPEYFPAITYKGVVSDTGSNSKVLSLSINDEEYVIREGATADSVLIIDGNSHRIKVRYKGNIKEFDISQL